MKVFLQRIGMVAIPEIAHLYVRLLRATMRIRREGAGVLEDARREPGQFILAFWHSRFLMMPYAYPGGRITVLLSRHRDAAMLSRLIARFGLETSFGSSTAGGAAGIRDILRKTRQGYDVGIAPDGPRGPRRRAKSGVIALARMTGLPIVPVAFSAAPATRLRSWDRTLVPRPFARGRFAYAAPIRVPRDADEPGQERLRLELEGVLDDLTNRLDEESGIGPEPPPEEERST